MVLWIGRLQSWITGLRRWHRLSRRRRAKLTSDQFRDEELLYRALSIEDIDSNGRYKIGAFESADVSVNWSKFCIPEDIRFRLGGSDRDGCMAFAVSVSRYQNLALPCHDPMEDNYAHAEIRWLKEGESVEPDHGRKVSSSKTEKAKRLAWRQHVCLNSIMVLDAS